MSEPNTEQAQLRECDEPTHLSARVIDRDGDAWALYEGRWGCLTTRSVSQMWGDLWNVCGPLTLAPGWGIDVLTRPGERT